MNKNSRIFVAGGNTLIGAAILRQLERQGYGNVLGGQNLTLDLTDFGQVDDFFSRQLPEYVIVAAGKSGGNRSQSQVPG